MKNRIDRWIIVLAVFLLVCLSSTITFAQVSASSFATINVARPISIRWKHDLDFGWIAPGQTKYLNGNTSTGMQFEVEGEGSSYFTIDFPLAASLTINGSGTGPVIPFTRAEVYEKTSSFIPATLWLIYPNTSGTLQLPGIPGGLYPQIRWFWTGGSIAAPAVLPPGYYRGYYTVTITNYYM